MRSVWVLFMVVALGVACAAPPRIPPVTYEPIASAGGASLPPSAGSADAAPASTEPQAAPSAAPTRPGKASGRTPTALNPTASADPPAPLAATGTPATNEDTCYRKYPNGCCGKVPFDGKRAGGKLICPKDMVPPGSCRTGGKCNK